MTIKGCLDIGYNWLGESSDNVLKDRQEYFVRTPFGFPGVWPEIYDRTIRNYGTAFHLMGTLPIIGRIIGLARVILATFTLLVQKFPESGCRDRYRLQLHVFRGCIEMAGLGLVLLITDVAMTYLKKHCIDNEWVRKLDYICTGLAVRNPG